MTTLTQRERRLCEALRELAVERLNEIDEDAAAEQLGLSSRGVWALMRQEEWDLETAFLVVDALGVDVLLEARSGDPAVWNNGTLTLIRRYLVPGYCYSLSYREVEYLAHFLRAAGGDVDKVSELIEGYETPFGLQLLYDMHRGTSPVTPQQEAARAHLITQGWI